LPLANRTACPSYLSTICTMSVNADIRVYAGDKVLFPGSQALRPATISVSTKTGKIIAVHEERHIRGDYPDIADDHWIDTGDKYILPGLVEYVWSLDSVPFLSGGAPTARVVCPAHMYTSTSLGERTGRVFGRAHAPQRLGALPPSWTCRSTRYRQRLRWKILR
jgi:hypothetical protein